MVFFLHQPLELKSPYLLDRFWQIDAQSYTLKPILSNLSFGYLDIEHTLPNNSIAKDFLSAQRWNGISNKWNDLSPIGVSDITNNMVTISSLNPSNLFKWWVLVDNANPLPLSFLSFSVQKIDNKANLLWTTTDEVNVRDFDVERSYNGIDFDSIGSVIANNNGNSLNYYKFIDPSVLDGKIYYKIKQNDINGIFKYSKIKTLTINNPGLIELYPNPVVNGKIVLNTLNVPEGTYTISLYDLQSQLVFYKTLHFDKKPVEIALNSQFQNGNYIAVISKPGFFFSKKITILRS